MQQSPPEHQRFMSVISINFVYVNIFSTQSSIHIVLIFYYLIFIFYSFSTYNVVLAANHSRLT